MLNKLEKQHDNFYFVFRILVGLLFMQHGAQKLFGVLGRDPVDSLFSLMGLAGVIELVGGLLVVVGLFTRITAIISGLEMLVAYFMAHLPQGFFPIMNGGENSLLFFAAFLILSVHGAKKWGLDTLSK